MGIKHLEALSLPDFLHAVNNLSSYIATEKLDGFNMRFGYNLGGAFYVRKRKKFCFEIDEWEHVPANNGFRSAHAALQFIEPRLRKVLDNGEEVEAEILYGCQPNAIIYGQSYISFLRMVRSPLGNRDPNQSKIQKLHDATSGQYVAVCTDTVYSEDGYDLKIQPWYYDWKFAAAPTIVYSEGRHYDYGFDISHELFKLDEFYNNSYKHYSNDFAPSYYDIVNINLNTVPKDLRKSVREDRESLSKHLMAKFKLPIKEKLLDAIVRRIKPGLRNAHANIPESDFGIEGIVFLDPKTQKQFKLVDKEVFTAINNFNFAIRNELRNSSFGPKKKVYGVTLSFPFKGDLYSHVFKSLDLILDMAAEPFENIKKRAKYCLIDHLSTLDDALQQHKAEWKFYYTVLKTRKRIEYTEAIHVRTLVTFAEVRQELDQLLGAILCSKSDNGLRSAILSKRPKSLR